MQLLKKMVPFAWKRGIKENLGVPSLHWSLVNLRKTGFNPAVIIDIGAYEGYWTLDAMEVFPGARILMIEAQQKKEAALHKLAAKNPNLEYAIALLSASDGSELLFSACETASQVVQQASAGDRVQILRTQTLDDLLMRRGFPMPDFLKLDVQGHEMEVLKGGEKSLGHAQLCLLEISLLDIGGHQPLLTDMINFMNGKNFQAYDITQFMRRPYDKALLQIDMMFIKKDSALIAEKRWA